MAQLFQPTNITPDLRGSFGGGVANMIKPYLTVSWQVNGNTPMTAFEITFYKNDGSGDQLYTTGQLTDGCPFYGFDPSGNAQLFTYSIDTIPLNRAGMYNGHEYQMKITQYWGSNGESSVEQLSPSVFITRSQPVFIIDNKDGTPIGVTITTRTMEVVARHQNQSSSGSILWIRWMLRNSEGTILKDTGKLYGSVTPTFTYDGLLPGQYAINFSCETEYGMMYPGTWITIPVSYSTSTSGIPVVASKACNGESAVSVRWPRLQSIPLVTQEGMVRDDGFAIDMDPGSSLYWNTVNGSPMSFGTPWSIVWSGDVTDDTEKLFTIQSGSNSCDAWLGYSPSGRLCVTLVYNAVIITRITIDDWIPGPVTCCITPTTIYWKYTVASGGPLFPREDLYPSDTLYPGWSGSKTQKTRIEDIDSQTYRQTRITSVKLYGPASVNYFKIIDHAMSEQEVYQYLNGEITPSYGSTAYFFIGAKGITQNYNAGNFPDDLQGATLVSIYRKTGDSGVLEYVGQTSVGAGNTIMDYAARSQQGPYTYYLYVLSSEKYINVPSISNQVDPCFWNWSVLSCTENADGSFTVQSSYLFGKNLQSGNISNNNQPGIFKNFTPYPTVMIAPQNYRGGTLQSLIGVINEGKYSDTISVRDAIYALSTTTNVLFLKDRKGDLLRIRPSGEIGMETMDNTEEQAQNVSFPWVEVGDASEAAVYNLGDAS